MKTKLLSALIGLVGLGTAVAQTPVYSQNVVGYVNVVFPKDQFVMVANPLDGGNNSITNLLQSPADFTTVYRWNGTTYDTAVYFLGEWDFSAWTGSMTLAPGQGVFVTAGDNFTNTFVGTVLQGKLTNSVPAAGYTMIASMVPQNGDADSLELTSALNDFDAVYVWNGSSYDVYTWLFGSWADPSNGTNPPPLGVGKAAFLFTDGPRQWVRTFNVSQ